MKIMLQVQREANMCAEQNSFWKQTCATYGKLPCVTEIAVLFNK